SVKAKPQATPKLSTSQARSKPKSMAEERKDRVNAPAAAIEGGAGSLEKVREILFGSQARDYEKRFTRLEERLIKESVDLKDEMRSRMESLETYIKKEIDALSDKLKSEHNDRKETNSEFSRDLKDLTKTV